MSAPIFTAALGAALVAAAALLDFPSLELRAFALARLKTRFPYVPGLLSFREAPAALAARGRTDLARELDGAWISTIHGFCNRLLKAYPFAAGLDPRFRELDDNQAAVPPSEAFRAAVAAGLGPQCAATTAGSRRLSSSAYTAFSRWVIWSALYLATNSSSALA